MLLKGEMGFNELVAWPTAPSKFHTQDGYVDSFFEGVELACLGLRNE
jgi:hypothetical protein